MMSQAAHIVNYFCIILGCVIINQAFGSQPSQSTRFVHDNHLLDYCNIPSSVGGNEGRSFPGYSLKLTDVILTPGQTSLPTSVKVQGQSISCDLKYDASSAPKYNTYAEASDVFRVVNREHHGFKEFHPSSNPTCASHHVTSYGVKQMISLGQHFSKVYFTDRSDIKLVPQASNVHVESIPMHSTYQSILPFLHGLLPEKQFTKIKLVKSLDNFCSLSNMVSGSCVCDHAEELGSYILRALEQGHYMFKDGIYESTLVNSIMDGCLDGKYGGIELFEYLMLDRCNNMSSLCDHGTSCICPTVQQLTQLYHIATKFLQHLNREPVFKSFSEMKAFPFLSRLIHRSFKNEEDKMNVYMGSRLFLQYMTTSLGFYHQDLLPLGSRMVFEIFQKNWNQPGAGSLFLRVLFNGEDVTSRVIGCHEFENDFCKLLNRYNSTFHPLPEDKMFDWFKFKKVADDNSRLTNI